MNEIKDIISEALRAAQRHQAQMLGCQDINIATMVVNSVATLEVRHFPTDEDGNLIKGEHGYATLVTFNFRSWEDESDLREMLVEMNNYFTALES